MTKRILILILATLSTGMVHAQQDFQTVVKKFDYSMERINADEKTKLEEAKNQYDSVKAQIHLENTINRIRFYIDGPNEFPSINECVSDFIKEHKDNPTNCPSDPSLMKIADTISRVNPDLKVFLDEVVLCKNIDTCVNRKMPADSKQMLNEARKKMDSFKFVKGTDTKKLLSDYVNEFFWYQEEGLFHQYLEEQHTKMINSNYDITIIKSIVESKRIPKYIDLVPYYKNTWEDFCNLARKIGENKSKEKIEKLEELIESVK